jgi:hypothetical protein
MATQRDIYESQERQDEGIKREFWNIHQKLDEQRLYMDDRFREQRLYMDERFREQRAYVDDRFQQVDDRFQQVDDRFQQVDDRFQQADDRFQELEVLIRNSRATSGWHDIFPVRVQNPLAEPRNRYQTPPYFPSKVVKFWRLQRSRHQHQLIELLRFYSIRASDLTTTIFEDGDDTESESSSESQFTLEEAVKENPAFALARLAARLGLDYGSISHNMGLYEQVQAVKVQQETQRVKREQPIDEDKKDKDVAGPTKKTAIPEIKAQRTGTGIPIEELIAHPETFPFESPPVQSHVSWAPRSKEDSLPLRISPSSKKTISTPSPPSKGSTIPFTQTPSVIKAARKTTSHTTKEPKKTASMHTSSKQSQTSEETSF